MKRAVIALLIAAGLIAGCGEAGGSIMTTDGTGASFQLIASFYDFYVVADKETRVMYAVSDGYYNHGTLTLLVDANGKPRLWEGE